jgi:hypothetical protein
MAGGAVRFGGHVSVVSGVPGGSQPFCGALERVAGWLFSGPGVGDGFTPAAGTCSSASKKSRGTNVVTGGTAEEDTSAVGGAIAGSVGPEGDDALLASVKSGADLPIHVWNRP